MGLAASQARLLSITSRLSDNELRAQLINNAKMRLTTDSSNVSNDYIAALNETKLMFTNYDILGNEQYQDLTFNSLTAYSSYNSQYGLVNNAGQLLVSETDARNFEAADGSLETFLGYYGLEQSTTYFDQNPTDTIGYYDDYGYWHDLGVSLADMQAIYEGGTDIDGVEHYGYDGSISAGSYGDYEELLADYNSAKDLYKSTVQKQMKAFINGDSSLSINNNNVKLVSNGKTISEWASLANNITSEDSLSAYVTALEGFLDILEGNNLLGKSDSNSYKNFDTIIRSFIDIAKADTNAEIPYYYYESASQTGGAYVLVGVNEETGEREYDPTTYDGTASWAGYTEKYITSGDDIEIDNYGGGTLSDTNVSGSDSCVIYKELDYDKYDYYEYLYQYTDDDGNIKYTLWDDYEGDTNDLSLVVLDQYDGAITYEPYTITEDEQIEAIQAAFNFLSNNLLSYLDESLFFGNDTVIEEAYNAYLDAAKALAEFIYGDNADAIINDSQFTGYADYLGDPAWVMSDNNYDSTARNYNPWAGVATSTSSEHQVFMGYEDDREVYETITCNGYQVVKDLFLMECMLDYYGEPNYTWIDKNNPNENADAKAQWYTNLFERMQQGYTIIADGLAGSAEWLKFAFESGLLHMEQVNSSQQWVSTMYSNCSNITESSVDVDITIAEATYTREMNKIEAKDKQYDMELKNIDTEHESLQTEYESIKTVIEKNIDRNYKIFSA